MRAYEATLEKEGVPKTVILLLPKGKKKKAREALVKKYNLDFAANITAIKRFKPKDPYVIHQ